jgi:hypothetical protein
MWVCRLCHYINSSIWCRVCGAHRHPRNERFRGKYESTIARLTIPDVLTAVQ